MVAIDDIKAIQDPNKCEGYGDAILDSEQTKQIDFLLPDKSETNPGVDLACSLIPSPSDDISPSAPGSTEDVRNVLEKLDKSRPLIIFCHGDRSYRNQMLLSTLASELSSILMCHTLRFDFTACGDSMPAPGDDKNRWKYSNIKQDYVDLCRVVDFIQEDLGVPVYCMCGHSQGSIAVLNYAAEHDKAADHEHKNDCVYVNLAGPYLGLEPHKLEDLFDSDVPAAKRVEYEKEGRCILETKNGHDYLVTREDVADREKQDIDEMVKKIKLSKVYTMHGDKDKDCSMANALKFKEILPGENCWMKMVEDSDHKFTNPKHVNFLLIKTEWHIRYYTTRARIDGSITPWFIQKKGVAYPY